MSKERIKKIKEQIEKIKDKLALIKDKLALLEEKEQYLKLQKKIASSKHHLFRNEDKTYETVCGYKLIPRKTKSNSFKFGLFKNATFYFDFLENKCPICEMNYRVAGDNCPKCGVFRLTPKHTYCGNCGKVTGKRRKLKGVPVKKKKGEGK